MEILPLTYDRYFKKVFSNTRITKQFLEDFLGIEIESIELFDKDFNVTNTSRELRFDCVGKADQQHFIVEMQQWYKYDVVKRFYLYHCANTLLQLENMPMRERLVRNRSTGEFKLKKEKDYSTLTPTITILWFVDDSFKITKEYVNYIVLPEDTKDFILNENLWSNKEKLEQTRQELINLLNNNEKGLTFLQDNKMIYALQRQIIKNDRQQKYFRWFDFAEKTKNKNNSKSDFYEYKDNDIFDEIMRLLSVQFVPEKDIKQAEDYCDYNEKYLKQVDMDYKRGFAKAKKELGQELKENKKELKENKKELKENKKELKENKKELETNKETIINSAKAMLQANMSVKQVQKITKLSKDLVKELHKNIDF